MKLLSVFVDWLSAFLQEDSRKAFAAGQLAARDEYLASLKERRVAAARRGLDVTLEGIKYARELEATGEAEVAAIAAYEASLIEQAQVMQRLAEQPMPEAESSLALDRPF